MSKPLIRDFIYLDVERVRSFVAQASGGLTSERTNQAQHQVGGEGQVEGNLPLILKASGSTDYHYLRSHSETKSLHDQIFEEFYHNLKPTEQIIDLSEVSTLEWVEPTFRDSLFVQVKGLLKIVDYQSIISSTQNLPTLLETIVRLATVNVGANPQPTNSTSSTTKQQTTSSQRPPKQQTTSSSPTITMNTDQAQQIREIQQMKTQFKNLPLKDFANFITQIYGDLVRVKVFPFPNDAEKLFVGTADRQLFRYSPSALVNLYGSVIDANWTYILQINKGRYHEPGLMASKTGNDVEDGLEQIADAFSSLANITQGIKFPAVAVTPIAIYREI